MVYSVMQLFGVSLDPTSFQHDDRVGATIALAQEILRNHGGPSWISAAYNLHPDPVLSSFPRFPITSVAEGPRFATREGLGSFEFQDALKYLSDEMASFYLGDMPEVLGMEDGILTFYTHAAEVIRATVQDEEAGKFVFKDLNGCYWPPGEHDDSESESIAGQMRRTLLVYIGLPVETYSSSVTLPQLLGEEFTWLVRECTPGQFRRLSCVPLYLSRKKRFDIFSYPKVAIPIGGDREDV